MGRGTESTLWAVAVAISLTALMWLLWIMLGGTSPRIPGGL